MDSQSNQKADKMVWVNIQYTLSGKIIVYTVFFLILLFSFSYAEEKILCREEFADLSHWKPFYFHKIEKHTVYTIESNGSQSYLKAISKASASGLIYKEEFNVYSYPTIKWKWKVDNVYQKGNAKTKEGDDYPIRIYILFKYNPDKATLWDKVSFKIIKGIYGEYPPHSSLNYIWESKEQTEGIITSPYTDRSKMILLQKGSKNIGLWIEEKINILEDYKKCFGSDPPPIASLAIMNDSDNTGEEAASYVDFIEVYQE